MAKSGEHNMSEDQILAMANLIKNAQDVKCECGCDIFHQANKLKRISKLVTGEEKDGFFPVPTVYCVKCQKEWTPEEDAPKEEGIIQLDFRKK